MIFSKNFYPLMLLSILWLCNFKTSWSRKIVGGENATEDQIPYQLQILVDDYFYCGATLVRLPVTGDYLFAVTAAHCLFTVDDDDNVIPVTNDQIKITAGSIDRLAPTQTVEVETQIIHPNFSNITVQNDVALLFFKTPFQLDKNIQPVQLDAISGYDGDLIVTGWGDTIQILDPPCDAEPDSTDNQPTGWTSSANKATGALVKPQKDDDDYDSDLPAILQVVQVPVFPLKECQEKLATVNCGVFPDMICAGGGSGDACYGDSGGPAVGARDGFKFLVGIISWGYGMDACIERNFYRLMSFMY